METTDIKPSELAQGFIDFIKTTLETSDRVLKAIENSKEPSEDDLLFLFRLFESMP